MDERFAPIDDPNETNVPFKPGAVRACPNCGSSDLQTGTLRGIHFWWSPKFIPDGGAGWRAYVFPGTNNTHHRAVNCKSCGLLMTRYPA